MTQATPYYLFFDYDHTVCVNGTISDETRLALQKVREKGARLILCTGRSRGHLSRIPELLTIPWDGMIWGGADLFYDGICLEERVVPQKEIFSWLDYAMRHRYQLLFEGQLQLHAFSFQMHPEAFSSQELHALKQEVKRILRYHPITKLTILEEAPDESDFPNTQMTPVIHPRYMEMFAPKCDKGLAIQRFCSYLKLSAEQCVCFGDSMNDAPMFRVCPISISMPWAPEELVHLSSYHAKGTEGVADGVAWLFSQVFC